MQRTVSQRLQLVGAVEAAGAAASGTFRDVPACSVRLSLLLIQFLSLVCFTLVLLCTFTL